jgi:hypothetical protein
MRSAVLIIVFILTLINASAQREVTDETPWNLKSRAYPGIGLGGLNFGNHPNYGRYFSIGAGALGGFMFTRDLSAGVGVEYQYTSFSEIDFRDHLYGGYPFIRYNIKNFFIQADYDLFSVKNHSLGTRSTEERLFLGAGFFSLTNRGSANFLISYDVLYLNSNSFAGPLNTRFFFTF